MERRSFLLGLLGVAGTAAFAGTLIPSAEATPLDQLRNLQPPRDEGHEPDIDDLETDDLAEGPAGETPDGTLVEDAQYWRRQRRRDWRRSDRYWRRRDRRWRRRSWRRRRWVCRRVWTRWGWRRRCYWRYWW